MALQNRVTPFGDIIAIPQRGMFTGNRGVIHDHQRRIVRDSQVRRWIACRLEFRGRHREVMARRSWTELFFLDEAVALAAGHRPCFFCRREAAQAFRNAWALGRAVKVPPATEMDAVLHAERLDHGRKRLHALPGPANELPDGSAIAAAGDAYILVHGRAFRWTAQGYEGPLQISRPDAVITPPSTLGAFRAGYRPALHPSIDTMQPASTDA